MIFKRTMLGRKYGFRALKACVDSGLPVDGRAVFPSVRENVHVCEPSCRAVKINKLTVFEIKRSVYIEVESRCCC